MNESELCVCGSILFLCDFICPIRTSILIEWIQIWMSLYVPLPKYRTIHNVAARIYTYRRSFCVTTFIKMFLSHSPAPIRHLKFKFKKKSMPTLGSAPTTWINSETKKKLVNKLKEKFPANCPILWRKINFANPFFYRAQRFILIANIFSDPLHFCF